MTTYKAPVRDIDFVINDVLDYQAHYAQIPGGEEATPDMIDAIIGEAAKFSEEVLAPLNQSGDEHGCVAQQTATVSSGALHTHYATMQALGVRWQRPVRAAGHALGATTPTL